MGNNIVCSRCGSANVRCEAMVNPNTKGFDHFTDEAFYYGWCENCGLGGALTDKEENPERNFGEIPQVQERECL